MSKSCGAVLGHAPLVKQVVFPVEVLPLKGLPASVIPQLIWTGMLFGYVLVRRGEVPLIYGLWPVLFLLQVLAMAGTSFLLSSVAVYFRDLKDVVQVFSLVGLYLMPVLYLPDWVPESFRPLLYANPFSHMVWCYQDVFYFAGVSHPVSWLVFSALSIGMYSAGYAVFRHLQPSFGNVL
jgi:lipopolysaccharide transport system permease protein